MRYSEHKPSTKLSFTWALLATLRAPGQLQNLSHAVSRIHVFTERETHPRIYQPLRGAERCIDKYQGEKRGLNAPDAWVRYVKEYIDTLRGGVLTQYVAIFPSRRSFA